MTMFRRPPNSTVLLLLLIALFGVGTGFQNGDIAVYVHQALEGDFSQRVIHIGYVFVASVLGNLAGDRLPLVLDLVNVGCGIAIVYGVVQLAGREDVYRGLAGLAAAIALLPVISWAEVDLAWLALVLWAAAIPIDGLGALFFAAAICVSPAALLSAPWLAWAKHRQSNVNSTIVVLLAGAALAAMVLGLGWGWEWFWGERGVLTGSAPLPWITASRFALALPFLFVALALPTWIRQRESYGIIWTLPVLLAPSDTAAWVLVAIPLCLAVAHARLLPLSLRRPAQLVLLAQLLLSGHAWWTTRQRVVAEREAIEALAAKVGPRVGVQAPWSWGVRLSLAATGDPYGATWIDLKHPVREQRKQWCQTDLHRVAVLPPGSLLGVPGGKWRQGIWWVESDPVVFKKLIDCPVHAPQASPVQAQAKPNVVLLIGCTVRRDRMGPKTTPWLDRLAQNGASFDDLVSTAPWTKPAVIAILTGRHALSLGMVEVGPGRNTQVLPATVPTLAQRLYDSGFTTIGLTANPNLNPAFGFERGFDAYNAPSPPWSEGVVKVSGEEMVGQALALIDAHVGTKPFYLQILLADPHAPRGSPPHDLGLYDQALGTLDRAGQLLDEGLDQRGFDKSNTYFVFVGDHGEGLGVPTHHGTGHGRYLYPTAMSVPWIIRGPKVPLGHKVRGLASGVDVAPTVLGLLDLPSLGVGGENLARWVFRGRRATEADSKHRFPVLESRPTEAGGPGYNSEFRGRRATEADSKHRFPVL
ncbi:MAG: sulfatase, partial [Proteobacteria bacterium]|nr:sulfatase [Pseudomonadota bacterium]